MPSQKQPLHTLIALACIMTSYGAHACNICCTHAWHTMHDADKACRHGNPAETALRHRFFREAACRISMRDIKPLYITLVSGETFAMGKSRRDDGL